MLDKISLVDLQRSFVNTFENVLKTSVMSENDTQTVISLAQLLFLQKMTLAFISHDFSGSKPAFFPIKLAELFDQYQKDLTLDEQQRLGGLVIKGLATSVEEFGGKLGQELDRPTKEKIASEIKQQVSKLNATPTTSA